MVLISIHPFAFRKIFLLAAALLGLSSALCFGDSLFMARQYAPSSVSRHAQIVAQPREGALLSAKLRSSSSSDWKYGADLNTPILIDAAFVGERFEIGEVISPGVLALAPLTEHGGFDGGLTLARSFHARIEVLSF